MLALDQIMADHLRKTSDGVMQKPDDELALNGMLDILDQQIRTQLAERFNVTDTQIVVRHGIAYEAVYQKSTKVREFLTWLRMELKTNFTMQARFTVGADGKIVEQKHNTESGDENMADETFVVLLSGDKATKMTEFVQKQGLSPLSGTLPSKMGVVLSYSVTPQEHSDASTVVFTVVKNFWHIPVSKIEEEVEQFISEQ